jgi:hypothetical protein
MSGGGGSQTIQQDATPWGPQQPYLEDLFARAQRAANNPPQFFPGETVAPLTADTQAAQQSLREYATGPGTQLANAATTSAQFNLGPGRDVATNPYLQSAITGAIRPVYEQLTEVGLPAIRRGADAAGQVGGSRQAIAEGLAVGRATRSAGDIAAQMASRGFETGTENALKTLALTPSVLGAGAVPAQQLDVIGAQNRALEQARIDEGVARHNFAQNLPWLQVQNLSEALRGSFGGTSTTTGPAPRTDPAMAALGGAAMGYGAAQAGLMGASVTGPIGAAIGAVAMLLLTSG